MNSKPRAPRHGVPHRGLLICSYFIDIGREYNKGYILRVLDCDYSIISYGSDVISLECAVCVITRNG